MPLHIEQAEQASRAANGSGLASAQVGDARSLPWAAETFDAILLLGPLYHLTSAEDRRQSLAEARRVLRPGGFLAAAAISRFASTYDGLGREFLMEPEFQAIVERDVREGQHRNPSRREDWFTTSYFHRPDELASEVEGGGFVDPAVFAVEGPAGWLGNLDMWLDQAERRKVLLDVIRRVEREPTLLGASLHLLAIAHRAPSNP
jgi:SAM-dependent methyltransferase